MIQKWRQWEGMIRSMKLSIYWLGQYWDGWPFGNHNFFQFGRNLFELRKNSIVNVRNFHDLMRVDGQMHGVIYQYISNASQKISPHLQLIGLYGSLACEGNEPIYYIWQMTCYPSVGTFDGAYGDCPLTSTTPYPLTTRFYFHIHSCLLMVMFKWILTIVLCVFYKWAKELWS